MLSLTVFDLKYLLWLLFNIACTKFAKRVTPIGAAIEQSIGGRVVQVGRQVNDCADA